ncbi:fatty acyl-CoA reductase [Marinobacteraceae bacterium S3BR75-40.1]
MTKHIKSTDMETSKVLKSLAGKQVLVTGTTGFVGKVLLEKLIRAVPDIGGIHLLIRGNRKHPQARDRFINEIACSSVFETLKVDDPEGFDRFCDEKIHCVTGEVTEPFFGMPRADFEVLAGQVDAIVNSAASVNFREELDQALKINTLCLHNLAALAREAGDVPMVQVSTCYVNGFNTGHMREEVVRPARGNIFRNEAGFYEVEELINVLQDKVADVKARYTGDKLAEKLVELGIREANRFGWNDTYTFTKWMGEQLLHKLLHGSTLTILRPAIVESTLQEPAPGWIEGVKVADAVIMAYAREKVMVFPGKRSGVIDVIPADLVGNSIILSLAEALLEPGKHRIYQCCSGSENPIKLGEFIDLLVAEAQSGYQKYDRLFYRQPTKPFLAVDRRLFDWFSRGVRLPLGLMDKGLKMMGQEIGLKQLDNLDTALKLATVFAFYTQPNYIFHNERLLDLAERMGEADKALFPVDSRLIDWKHYLGNVHLAGLNKYALKERKLYRLKSKKDKRKVA